nr:terminase large subunit [Leucobacter ruminantium]
MPWQQLVVDRATEYRIIGPGESEGDRHLGRRGYRYHKVIVTVPRQSGKTTLMSPVRVHRMMTRPNAKLFATAQTGQDAGKRMRDMIGRVVESPIAPLFKPRFSAGSEGLACIGNGSILTRFSPLPSALHGETPLMVDYDEFWKYDRVLGEALMGAVVPAMATLQGLTQIWLVSTMGTSDSDFMNAEVEAGRAGAPGVAYFEWSMPDGADPFDPATWWEFHPALGNTIGEQTIADASTSLSYGEYVRGYMNRLTETVNAIVEAEALRTLVTTWDDPPAWKDIAVGYEVAAGGTAATVYGVWRDAAGNPQAHIIHSAPGTVWLVPLLKQIAELEPAVIAADDGGETRAITDQLVRDGIDVYTTGARDFGTACIALLTAMRDDQTFRYDGSDAFTQAVMHAVLRPSGDSWRFSRAHSTGPIAALIAVAVALWAYDHRDDPLGTPYIYLGED